MLASPFTPAEKVDLPQRTILSVEGRRGSGKSEFGLWGPAPVAYHRFDMASEGALRKIRTLRPSAIQVCTYNFERPQTAKNEKGQVQKFDKDVIEEATETYNAFVRDYRYALANGFKSVTIDDGATLWEIFRVARFGKVEQVPQERYGIVNLEFKRMLKESLEAGACLTVLHPTKEEWIKVQDENNRWTSTKTGRFEPQGFSKMELIAGAIIRLFRFGDESDPTKAPAGSPPFGQFGCQFTKANERGELVGEVINFNEYAAADMPNTFGVVMSLLYPDTEPSDWL